MEGLQRKFRCGAAVVFGLLGLAVAFVFFESERVFDRRYPLPDVWRAPDGSASQYKNARGRHVATTIAQCQFCHGTDLGGREAADDPLIGRIDASNLTSGRGGVAREFDDADWERALRFGLRSDGRSLLLMPSRHLSTISDDDLAAVIAYLRQVPSVDRETRPVRIGPLTRIAVALGGVRDIFSAVDVSPEGVAFRGPVDEATTEYGEYLVALGNCRVCHHADLQGGLHPLALPGEPPPPSLQGVTAMQGWSFDDFAEAMRGGQTPSGRSLDRAYMPWPGFAGLSDTELRALWLYLRGGAEVEESASEQIEIVDLGSGGEP